MNGLPPIPPEVLARLQGQQQPQPQPQRPSGIDIVAAHNAIAAVTQLYGNLLLEQQRRIDILAQQLGQEQQQRAKLVAENAQLRDRLAKRSEDADAVDVRVHQEVAKEESPQGA